MKNTYYLMPSRAYVSGQPNGGQEPVKVIVKGSKKAVFEKIIPFFFENNIEVKVADFKTGKIESARIGLGSHYNLVGLPMSNNDFVVCERQLETGQHQLFRYPNLVSGALELTIVDLDSARSEVTIELAQIRAIQHANGANLSLKTESTQQLELRLARFLQTDSAAVVPKIPFPNPNDYFDEPVIQQNKRVETVVREERQVSQNYVDKQAAGLTFLLIGIGIVAYFAYQSREE